MSNVSDHPSRPGRPHVTKVSDREAFMIWEEPESDGNSYITAYSVDWHKPGRREGYVGDRVRVMSKVSITQIT